MGALLVCTRRSPPNGVLLHRSGIRHETHQEVASKQIGVVRRTATKLFTRPLHWAMLAVTHNIRGERRVGCETDVQYDWYGRRLATASTDLTVRIRDLDERGEWVIHDGCEIMNAHAGVICRVAWAHPQFGQVLATCSRDGSAKVWVENVSASAARRDDERDTTWTRWTRKATLSENRIMVNDVQFAPRHLGLKLATASADGNVRVYNATDLAAMSQWSLADVFGAGHGVQRQAGVLCLSWCKSRFDLPMMVLGNAVGRVQIWRHYESFMAWMKVFELKGHDSRPVTSVDWAEHMGRSFFHVASCGADGTLHVHKIDRRWSDRGEAEAYDVGQSNRLSEAQITSESLPQDDPESNAWRVQWDRTGTELVTCGDDGMVHVWRCDYEEQWSRAEDLDEKACGIGSSCAAAPSGEETAAAAATIT